MKSGHLRGKDLIILDRDFVELIKAVIYDGRHSKQAHARDQTASYMDVSAAVLLKIVIARQYQYVST
jgi:hypothetical protein